MVLDTPCAAAIPLELHSMPAPPSASPSDGPPRSRSRVPLRRSDKGRENEILLRDGGSVADSGKQDRLVWIAIDDDQRIRPDIGDRHAVPEVVGGDPKG